MIKRTITISIVAVLTMTLISRISAQNRPAFYGLGRQDCGVWYVDGRPRNGIANDARSSPAGNQYYTQWVDGFVSGVAYASTEPIAQGDGDAIVQHFLNDYCADHPSDTFETAAKTLLVELKKR